MRVEFSSVVIVYCTYLKTEQHPWPGATVLRSGGPQGTNHSAQGSCQACARWWKTRQDRQTQWQAGEYKETMR